MNLKRKISFLMGLVLVAGVGCGGTSNNDQGTSFTALGFFSDSEGKVGVVGTSLALFTDVSPTQTDGLFSVTYMSFQNNLSSQFIRVNRIDCDYEVQGSFIDVPSDSTPVGLVLAATGTGTTAGTGTTTGTGTTGTTGTTTQGTSTGYAGFFVVSSDLYSFLNNNKAYLPELPFRMTATCSATGVTQAGDVITTNPLNYFIQFVDQAECCTGTGTTPGFQSGPGSGGDLIVAPSTDGTTTTTTNSVSTNSSSSDTVVQ